MVIDEFHDTAHIDGRQWMAEGSTLTAVQDRRRGTRRVDLAVQAG
jgi:hypothetical protein